MEEEIAAVIGRFRAAAVAGDGAAIGALYTVDARFMPPNCEVVVGSQAIGAFAQEIFDAGIESIELHTVELEVHGDTAIEEGRYRLVAAAGETVDEGKYLVVWKRVEGVWKLHKDIFNSDQRDG